MLSYKPLFKMLEQRGISKMKFKNDVGISNATLAKFGKGEAVSLTTVEKICKTYNCKIKNVVKYINDYRINTYNHIHKGD